MRDASVNKMSVMLFLPSNPFYFVGPVTDMLGGVDMADFCGKRLKG